MDWEGNGKLDWSGATNLGGYWVTLVIIPTKGWLWLGVLSRFYKLYSILQIITDWKNIPGIDFSKLANVDWSKIPDVDVSKILGNVDWSKISVTKISAQN